MAWAALSRILVVDDDRAVRASMAMLLSTMGLAATLAEDGQAAIQHVIRQPHDLAMVDRSLPDMRCDDLVRMLRINAPNMLIVIVSGWARSPEMRNLSADLYLEKPILPRQLREILEDVHRRAEFSASQL